MITLSLNGEKTQLAANETLLDAIAAWQLQQQKFAIAINEQFIPKSAYADTVLQDGDNIELLIPMQGG